MARCNVFLLLYEGKRNWQSLHLRQQVSGSNKHEELDIKLKQMAMMHQMRHTNTTRIVLSCAPY